MTEKTYVGPRTAEFLQQLKEIREYREAKEAARANRPPQPTIADVMAMLEKLMAEMVALRSAA